MKQSASLECSNLLRAQAIQSQHKKNLQIVGEKGSKTAEFGKVYKDKGKRYLAHQKNLHLILVLHTMKRFL